MSLEGVKPGRRAGSKSRIAGGAAAAVGLGALACGVCCVLPFALPAAVLAVSGGVLAWLAGAHTWLTALAAAAVAAAWIWTGADTLRTRRRPAGSTLATLAGATLLLALAVAWPRVEPAVLGWFRG